MARGKMRPTLAYDHAHIRNVRNPVITFPRTFFLQPIRGRLSLLPPPQANGGTDQDFPFSRDIIGVTH